MQTLVRPSEMRLVSEIGRVHHLDPAFVQLPRQIAMAIAIDLQPERTPGRHSHVAQPQILVDEIHVAVQAFAVVRLQVRLVRLLVVPRLIGAARFHCRQNAHQTEFHENPPPAEVILMYTAPSRWKIKIPA
jgi:hypothetical protein